MDKTRKMMKLRPITIRSKKMDTWPVIFIVHIIHTFTLLMYLHFEPDLDEERLYVISIGKFQAGMISDA